MCGDNLTRGDGVSNAVMDSLQCTTGIDSTKCKCLVLV